MKDDYGKELRIYREDTLKMTQRDFAEAIGVTRYTLAKVEKGDIDASATFRKLVENYKEISQLKALSDSTSLNDAIFMYLIKHYSISDKFSIISRYITEILDCGDLDSTQQTDYTEEMYMLIGAFSQLMSYLRICAEKNKPPKRETIQAHSSDLFSIAVRFAKK